MNFVCFHLQRKFISISRARRKTKMLTAFEILFEFAIRFASTLMLITLIEEKKATGSHPLCAFSFAWIHLMPKLMLIFAEALKARQDGGRWCVLRAFCSLSRGFLSLKASKVVNFQWRRPRLLVKKDYIEEPCDSTTKRLKRFDQFFARTDAREKFNFVLPRCDKKQEPIFYGRRFFHVIIKSGHP